jgi:hypothetical protein
MNKWKSEIRDLKMDMLTGDMSMEITKEAIAALAPQLRIVKENVPSGVITGSVALKLHGLLDRETSDIDVLIDDAGMFGGYKGSHSYGDENPLSNRLGYITFQERESGLLDRILAYMRREKTLCHQVDFFLAEDTPHTVIEFEGAMLKVHDPFAILETKEALAVNLSRGFGIKHERDLYRIFCRS